jgi:hypothetical protein
MAWYYYSGPITQAIRVSSTKSVAVHPHTKVEILEVTREVQALMNSQVLRRCGRPLGAKSIADEPVAPPVRMQDVLPKSSLAQHFAEKGVTPSKAMPPKKPVGSPEYTVHELALAEKGISAPSGGDAPAVAVDPAVPAAPVVSAEEKSEKSSKKMKRWQDR